MCIYLRLSESVSVRLVFVFLGLRKLSVCFLFFLIDLLFGVFVYRDTYKVLCSKTTVKWYEGLRV